MDFLTEDTKQWLEEKCPSRVNMSNVYECRACGFKLVVIHKDTGVTPMFLSHREEYGGPSDCVGEMVSWGYPNMTAILFEPTYEFYRPSMQEFERMSEAMKGHLRDGGLVLRKFVG